ISWSGGDLTSMLSAAQIQSLIDGFSVDNDSWDYSILNSLVQFLAEDETITLSFDVTVTDNDGGSDTKTVVITINGNNDPVEGEFTKEIWVPASFDELVIPYADGYPLNIAPPTDTDSNDTLTITVTGLPEFGTVGYYDGNVFIELTNNMELTSEQLANLIYVPVGDDLAHDMSLTFDIQSGSEVVQAEFIIHTAPPASLPGQTVQIGDGSSPLTSGNDQESQLILTTEFANNLANNPGLATLQLFTDFQKSPFATPIPGDEIGGTTGDKRESEVSIRLTINGIVFVVLEAANGIADWFYDPDSGLMKANFDYSDIYQEGHVGDANFSLLNYLSNSYTPTGGDIWTVTYLDNDGGSYQARFLQANFVFDNTGDPSITVTGTDNVDNLIFGGTSGDTLTGANLDDRIFGREGDDTIIGLDGDDELLGGAGDDTLSGGLGNDYLVGGPGNDSLDGGVDTDKDTFVWDVGSDDGSIDSVYNFDSNYDVLDLSDVLVDEENFSLEDYLNFNFNNLTNSTEIYVDSDRDGNIDLTIVLDNVNLNNTNTLTDIQVINNLLGDNALIVDTIP
ncbi:calcium-binding protein, partial [Shewanella waksmanii]|uniref:calcium-binding protein n=1 Tax=Shewanella waksmanii TaxID=213783 RepID=UPI003735771C